MLKNWSTRRKVLVGALVVLIVIIVIGVVVGDGGEEDAPQVTKAGPTSTSEPVISISANELYAEREANATRYDDTYKGKWIIVTGTVREIDGGDVRLLVQGDDFGIFSVDLQDVPRSEQVQLNKGDQIAARCRVGDYIIGTIYLKSCKLN